MARFETLDNITNNIVSVLRDRGVVFSNEIFDDFRAIPPSLIPFGQVLFQGMRFECQNKQRPSYAEAVFLIRIVLLEKDMRLLTKEEQKFVQTIRDGITVNSLNIGTLAESKLISRIETEDVSINHELAGYSVVNYRLAIKYRE